MEGGIRSPQSAEVGVVPLLDLSPQGGLPPAALAPSRAKDIRGALCVSGCAGTLRLRLNRLSKPLR